jgi:SAM-dependent methyltransferase
MTTAEWDLYQRAMRCIARLTAPEVSRRVPVPAGARALLDIGGANGVYATALCHQHANLHATILDLPEAIAAAASFQAPAGMSARITYRAADALTADLGHATYDLIFVANLVHHFDDATNRALARRVADALKPGGTYVIQDGVRERPRLGNRQFGALGDLFFALTSAAGAWSFAEMAAWQCAAGLLPRRPIRLLTAPSQGLQVATKP